MEQSHNPYAPSRATLASDEVRTGAHLWRLKKILIMSRDGDLPPRCVKCNETADEPTKTRTVYWHHPGFYVLLLINIILYAVVALIARKTAKVSPALCAQHKQRRTKGILIAWSGFIVGFVAMSIALGSNHMAVGLLLLFAMLGAIITGLVMSRVVYAKRIDDRYVQLKGCGDAFLSDLPEFRPGTREL
jgi:hypothetical protein